MKKLFYSLFLTILLTLASCWWQESENNSQVPEKKKVQIVDNQVDKKEIETKGSENEEENSSENLEGEMEEVSKDENLDENLNDAKEVLEGNPEKEEILEDLKELEDDFYKVFDDSKTIMITIKTKVKANSNELSDEYQTLYWDFKNRKVRVDIRWADNKLQRMYKDDSKEEKCTALNEEDLKCGWSIWSLFDIRDLYSKELIMDPARVSNSDNWVNLISEEEMLWEKVKCYSLEKEWSNIKSCFNKYTVSFYSFDSNKTQDFVEVVEYIENPEIDFSNLEQSLSKYTNHR